MATPRAVGARRPSTAAAAAATLDRLGAIGFDVALADGQLDDGWRRLDRYAADPATLEAGLRVAGARFGCPDRSSLSGGWLVADVAAAVAWPTVAVLLRHGAVLVTAATDVYLPAPDRQQRLTARLRAPERLRAAEPEAIASGIVATLQPVVEAVHERTRRGRHALWGTVTDMVAAAFHRVGDHLGCRDEARRLAVDVLEAAPALPGGANWHDVHWSGGTERTRVRNVCCLWYQTPGGDLCLTCPRISDPDRVALLERRRAPG